MYVYNPKMKFNFSHVLALYDRAWMVIRSIYARIRISFIIRDYKSPPPPPPPPMDLH